MSEISSALWLSLEVALAATALVALLGIPAAFVLARRRFWGRSIIEALLTVPLVLPPTVVGYLIIMVLGARGLIGSWLRQRFGYTILFTVEGAVIAAAVVSLPLLLLPAKAAFAAVEVEMEDIARLMGASSLQIFWHVSLPLARRGIAAGLLLAFARALGEFGATVMVLGNIEGMRTLPIEIYGDWISGEMYKAAPAVALLGMVSLIMIVIYNRFGPLSR